MIVSSMFTDWYSEVPRNQNVGRTGLILEEICGIHNLSHYVHLYVGLQVSTEPGARSLNAMLPPTITMRMSANKKS